MTHRVSPRVVALGNGPDLKFHFLTRKRSFLTHFMHFFVFLCVFWPCLTVSRRISPYPMHFRPAAGSTALLVVNIANMCLQHIRARIFDLLFRVFPPFWPYLAVSHHISPYVVNFRPAAGFDDTSGGAYNKYVYTTHTGQDF